MKFIYTPVLQTERLTLRPFRAEDAREVFECWESDAKVAKYMFWTSHNDIAKTREWIAGEIAKISSAEWYRWSIELKASGQLIGTGLIYYEPEYRCFEIGYNLGRAFWGLGYASEAMRAVIAFAAAELEIHEIVARYAKENTASGKLLSKLGFEYLRDIPYEANDGAVLYDGALCRLALP